MYKIVSTNIIQRVDIHSKVLIYQCIMLIKVQFKWQYLVTQGNTHQLYLIWRIQIMLINNTKWLTVSIVGVTGKQAHGHEITKDQIKYDS